MNEEARQKAKQRVNRISGQVAGIGRMIEEDRYCVDILNQIAAARAALDSLGLHVLTEHLESCVVGHGTDTAHRHTQAMTREQLVEEIRAVIAQFLK